MLTAVRAQLAADLGAVGVPVHQTWPDRLSAPCVLLVPPQTGSYVTGGQTFRTYTVAVDLVLLVAAGSHEVILPALETLIAEVLHHTEDWQLSGVDSPSVVTIGTVDHLGTVIHISKQVQA